MKITITLEKNDRKGHRMTKDCKINTDRPVQNIAELKEFILNSLIDWFDEYENQPTAAQLHPE